MRMSCNMLLPLFSSKVYLRSWACLSRYWDPDYWTILILLRMGVSIGVHISITNYFNTASYSDPYDKVRTRFGLHGCCICLVHHASTHVFHLESRLQHCCLEIASNSPPTISMSSNDKYNYSHYFNLNSYLICWGTIN